VLVPLAVGRPRWARDALSRLGARPVAGGAAAGAALSLGLGIAGLPVAIAAHERAVDYGLSTQGLASWLGDAAKSAGIGAALAAGGGALLIVGVRRFGRRWWLPGSVAVVAFGAISTWLAPVVIAPLFNRFQPLPDNSPARAQVLELGRRAGRLRVGPGGDPQAPGSVQGGKGPAEVPAGFQQQAPGPCRPIEMVGCRRSLEQPALVGNGSGNCSGRRSGALRV